MSWRTIIIEEADRVNLFLDNLVVTNNQENLKIPLNEINSVLFASNKINISINIINKLGEFKILTIFCDVSFKPSSMIFPFKTHYKQLEIFNFQLSWNNEEKKRVWSNIVKNKIENQIETLKINLKNIDKIKRMYEYIEEMKFGDISNREGHAAKLYFRELYGNDFRRDDDNYINSGLNFGYTILRSAFSRAIVSKGMHPTIAIFHHNMYNAFALADDLMEPFRPIVDNWVYQNILKDDYFSRNHKIELINLLNSKIKFNNQNLYLHNAIDLYVENFIKSMKEKIYIDNPVISSIVYYEL